MSTTSLRPILEAGVEANASDWHIRQGSSVVLRVDGELVEMSGFVPDREFLEKALTEMCTQKDLSKFDEHGDSDFAHAEEGIGRFRVNLHRQRGLISLTFRHIKAKVPDFAKLGLPPVLQQLAGAERGIVAFTALPVLLARAALDRVERDGPGSKLSRGEVLGIAGRLEQALRSDLPAIPGP